MDTNTVENNERIFLINSTKKELVHVHNELRQISALLKSESSFGKNLVLPVYWNKLSQVKQSLEEILQSISMHIDARKVIGE